MKKEPEINQVPLTSPDERENRIETLRRLFPDLFDGDGMLDEKALRTLLSEDVPNIKERFRFEWASKTLSKRFAFAPSKATLTFDPTRSVNADGNTLEEAAELEACSSDNIIIEGDNLEVLKLLSKSYFEKIKCIYIDPPYNTGRDFIYADNYSSTREDYWQAAGQKSEGVRLTAVSESGGRRHSNWLNMMHSRLLLARNTLRPDGTIFVSIDNVEYANLKKLMDEIFGEDQYIQTIIWKKRSTPPQDKIIGAQHDYILIYAKDENHVALNLKERSEKQIAAYKNPDNHPKGPWFSGDLTANVKGGRYVKSLNFPIKNPNTGQEHWPGEYGNWRFSADTIKELMKNDEIYFGPDGNGSPKLKRFLCDVKEGVTYSSIWDFVPLNQAGSREIEDLLGSASVFDNPKPVGLIEEIIKLGSQDNDIVLDFFAGSGTTAHACQNLAAQGKHRKYILVQIPEETPADSEARRVGFARVSDLTVERVKKSATSLVEGNPDSKLDAGFRVFQLSQSNFPENTFNPDPSKSEEENLKALESHLAAAAQKSIFDDDSFGSVVTEIALKFGFGLFYQTRHLAEDYPRNAVYRIDGNEKGALLCLDDDLHGETIEALKAHGDEQLIVAKSALDTTKKFELHNAFKDNLWVV